MSKKEEMELLVSQKSNQSGEENVNHEARELAEKLVEAIRQENDDAWDRLQNLAKSKHLQTDLATYSDRLLQVAVRYNRLEKVLKIFPKLDINRCNPKGESALHLAAESGSFEAIVKLLELGAKVDAKDNKGYTPLHSAMKSRSPNLEIVRLLVKKCTGNGQAKKVEQYGEERLYNQVDNLGNTPLHLATIYMSTEREKCLNCITELKKFDPNHKNHRGDSTMHLAARRENTQVFEAMLKVFYSHEKNIESHVTDRHGNTLLDLAATKGSEDIVAMLLDYGANPRTGVLYKLVSESVRFPECKETMCKIYRLIMENVDKWSDGNNTEEITEILNNSASGKYNGMNVIEHAIESGAVDMLEEILHTGALYEIDEDGKFRFRVRYCTPSREKISLLERIVTCNKVDVGAEMLSIQPLMHIASPYLWLSNVVYLVVFIFQLLYMLLFSCFCIPDPCKLSSHFKFNVTNCNSNDILNYDEILRHNVGFIFWPLATLLGTIGLKIYQMRKDVFVRRLDLGAHLLSFSFSAIVIFWFAVSITGSSYDIYLAVTAVLFIFGWMQTYFYLSYLGQLYIFTLLVKAMILSDVLKLACVFIFIIIGFSLAIYSLGQTGVLYSLSSLTDTVYLTFAASLNLGSMFGETMVGSDFQQSGGNLQMLRIIFAVYLISTFIILLNILIAMMSDTYQSNNKNAKAKWKLEILKLSLELMISKQKSAENPVLPETLAQAIIWSTPTKEEVSDDTDVSLLQF